MNEFSWSITGSAAVGGLVTIVANGHFEQNWNYFVVFGILFIVYWLLRLGADLGDIIP